MKHIINDFVDARQNLLNEFEIKNDYYIKVLNGYNWSIRKEEDVFFVKYTKDNKTHENIVINTNNLVVTEGQTHSLIVVIDCVKVCLLLENNLKEN